MAIQRLVKMTFQKDRSEEFEQFFTKIKSQIESQPGCNSVKLMKDQANSGIFFTFSVWDDQASIDAYRNTELFGKVWPTVKKWFADKPEAWSTELID